MKYGIPLTDYEQTTIHDYGLVGQITRGRYYWWDGAAKYGVLYNLTSRQIRQIVIADTDNELAAAVTPWPADRMMLLPISEKRLTFHRIREHVGDPISEDNRQPPDPPNYPPEDLVVLTKFHTEVNPTWNQTERDILAKYGIIV